MLISTSSKGHLVASGTDSPLPIMEKDGLARYFLIPEITSGMSHLTRFSDRYASSCYLLDAELHSTDHQGASATNMNFLVSLSFVLSAKWFFVIGLISCLSIGNLLKSILFRG